MRTRASGSGKHLKFTSFKETNELSWFDSLSLANLLADESTALKFLLQLTDLDLVMKLANANADIERLCKKPGCLHHWKKFYWVFGYFVSKDVGTNVNFLTHDGVESSELSFDLLRGAYYFYKSQSIKNELNNDFLPDELLFLKQAMKYNSIHAVQRYNSYLYQQIKNSDQTDYQIHELYMEIIKNCKSMLNFYGSYAYMMLAEAYFHYAEFSITHDVWPRTQSAVNAAISATKQADLNLVDSEASIHNASLGCGLEKSNSFQFTNPADLQNEIQSWFGDCNSMQQKNQSPTL